MRKVSVKSTSPTPSNKRPHDVVSSTSSTQESESQTKTDPNQQQQQQQVNGTNGQTTLAKKGSKKKKKSKKAKKTLTDPMKIVEAVLEKSSFKVPNLSQKIKEKFHETPEYQCKLWGVVYEPTVGPTVDGFSDVNISVLPRDFDGQVNLSPSAIMSLKCINQVPEKRRKNKKRKITNTDHKQQQPKQHQQQQQQAIKKD